MAAATTQIAIIGAGPYGLSLAAHLRARGIAFRIFGAPMRFWASMPQGMFLKSESWATNISTPQHTYQLADYCQHKSLDPSALIPLTSFAEYGQWFQEHAVPDVEPVEVTDLAHEGQSFVLTLATGERVTAAHVVIAVGLTYFERMPAIYADLPSSLASHTNAHREFTRFREREVVVIGGGQSALQTAALLHEHGARVTVLVRRPEVTFNPFLAPGSRSWRQRLRSPVSGLGNGRRNWAYEHLPQVFHALSEERRMRLVRTELGPAGAWWLRERVEGRFPVLTGREVLAAQPEGDGLTLRVGQRDGGESVLHADHVIAGTGFEVDVDRLPFFAPPLAASVRRIASTPAPALTRHFESSVPGLYFVGAAASFSFGPMMRFVLGAEFTARTVARHLAQSVIRSEAHDARGLAVGATDDTATPDRVLVRTRGELGQVAPADE